MSSKDPSFKKTASPDKAPPKKGARREKEAPAKETKNKAKDKFLASQAAKSVYPLTHALSATQSITHISNYPIKRLLLIPCTGTSSIKLRKDGASDREVQKILTEVGFFFFVSFGRSTNLADESEERPKEKVDEFGENCFRGCQVCFSSH